MSSRSLSFKMLPNGRWEHKNPGDSKWAQDVNLLLKQIINENKVAVIDKLVIYSPNWKIKAIHANATAMNVYEEEVIFVIPWEITDIKAEVANICTIYLLQKNHK